MQRAFWVLLIVILGWSVWFSHTSTPFSWAAGGDGATIRVSVAADGSEGNGPSSGGAISADGAWAAFASYADTLVPDDTNGTSDLFLVHSPDGAIRRIAQSPSPGTVRLSADGRYLAFASYTSDLVPGDTNDHEDCFLYDRVSGSMELISITTGGQQSGPGCTLADMTPDGRYVTFTSIGIYTPDEPPTDAHDADVFLRDRTAGTTTRITAMDSGALWCYCTAGGAISDDGRWVAFSSSQPLAAGTPSERSQIFLVDRTLDTITLVSVSPTGTPASDDSYSPEISGDGTTVAYISLADNLAAHNVYGPDLFLYKVQTGATTWITERADGEAARMELNALSAGGDYLLFTTDVSNLVNSDTNNADDVFLYDAGAARTILISVSSHGWQADDDSAGIGMTPDGQRALFSTGAGNLVENDLNNAADVFLRTIETLPLPTRTPTVTATATRTRLPVGIFLPLAGRQTGFPTYPRLTNLTSGANGASFAPVTDAAGHTVAFLSDATNLVPNDTNGVIDAFVWQKPAGTIRRVSVATDGTQANGQTTAVMISENGRYVLLLTDAGNLAAGDTNGVADVYRHDLYTGATEWVSVGMDGAAPSGITTGADISADGRWIVFSSQARNITATPMPATCPESACESLYRRDMVTGVTETWLLTPEGIALTPLRNPSLSADGMRVAFEQMTLTGYTNHCQENCLLPEPVFDPFIYLFDSSNGTVTLVARSTYDEAGRPDDPEAAMAWIIRNRVRLPVLARTAPQVLYGYSNALATQYNSDSEVGLVSKGMNGGHTIPMLYEIRTETTNGIALPRQPEAAPLPPRRSHALSADGSHIAFAVFDLRRYEVNSQTHVTTTPDIPGDANQLTDIYRYDVTTQRLERISVTPNGGLSNGNSREPFVAAVGHAIVFASEANNLSSGDTNGMMDIFLWESVR